MSKTYSNKALPPGTVLREWRLEDVLGVGGFGIVYKGRGIYFDELVAIKEYFPSSISERDEDATVVPIDSNAEEVHALGLKKFVEEAKLLWNLSTPSRHPNIVSVRSLFEIHGTAYMVMDFEDGVSLSKMLKQGKRFNEASLLALVKPIAEGLDRAHRVGVLHRDIKPPNILINPDGRAVLIDFGSARFESGEATSTKVTFHTPPYAAIEQYVKTYDQGPWTDIYALGVVLYECVTGEKPPEVLERMHGGLGKSLTAGEWPGFSNRFLAAIDAAMAIRPTERPQSISQWLALFDEADESADGFDDADDDDVTRVVDFASAPEDLVPVAPPPPGFNDGRNVTTDVPTDPKEAQFKRAGEDTNASKKVSAPPPPVEAPAAAADSVPAPASAAAEIGQVSPKKDGGKEAPSGKRTAATASGIAKDAGGSAADAKKGAERFDPKLVGAGALALALLVAGGVYLVGGGSERGPDPALATEVGGTPVEVVDIEAAGGILAAIQSLAGDARSGGASADAVKSLTDASARLKELDAGLKSLAADPAQREAASESEAEMGRIAMTASAEFAQILTKDAEGRARRVARDLPWADPANGRAAAAEPASKQRIGSRLRQALQNMRAASSRAASAEGPAEALTYARQALATDKAFKRAVSLAYAAKAEPTMAESAPDASRSPQQMEAVAAPTAAASASAEPDSGAGVSAAKRKQFDTLVASARDIAKQVIQMGNRDKPGSNATDAEKDGYRVRQASAKTAREYESYLATLEASLAGTKSNAEADQSIAKANQTKSYLMLLLSRSTSTLP